MTEMATLDSVSMTPGSVDALSEDKLDWLENQARRSMSEWLSRALFGAAMVLTASVAVVALALGLLHHS